MLGAPMRKRNQFKTLREWREANDLSQREAALRFGCSQPGWNKIELGVRHPRPELAGRLVRGTGVPLEVLMGVTL